MGAKDERARLAEVLEAAGPDHPTLCEGWDTHGAQIVFTGDPGLISALATAKLGL